MLELCLFDLDNTLVKTDDLEDIRAAFANNADPARLQELARRIALDPGRRVYSHAFLLSLRQRFPELKLGVFTRAPRSYTRAVLDWAYPGFAWDAEIVYEDLGARTKPHGDGVLLAMQRLQLRNSKAVGLIGDNDADMKAGYNAGCLVAVDKRTWRWPFSWAQWGAVKLVPDAEVTADDDVTEFIRDHRPFLPNFERLLEGAAPDQGWRYDKLAHWVDRDAEQDSRRYLISVAGRSFSNYASVRARRQGHLLSDSIEANKASVLFPPAWIEVIRNFVSLTIDGSYGLQDIVLSVIPHRPERPPRLESLLRMVEASLAASPLAAAITCAPDLLAYRAGVRSNHGDFLSPSARFANVRDHLFVQRPDLVDDSRCYIVLDDVVTTGASLLYAQKRLEGAGASSVNLLGLGKNVSDLYR